MESKGDLDNSVLILLSDHGLRFGSFAGTAVGDMENNLPFLYFAFPTWFHEKFSHLVANVERNSVRLVTPYDVRKTLQHLLHLQTNASHLWSNDAGDGAQVLVMWCALFHFCIRASC